MIDYEEMTLNCIKGNDRLGYPRLHLRKVLVERGMESFAEQVCDIIWAKECEKVGTSENNHVLIDLLGDGDIQLDIKGVFDYEDLLRGYLGDDLDAYIDCMISHNKMCRSINQEIEFLKSLPTKTLREILKKIDIYAQTLYDSSELMEDTKESIIERIKAELLSRNKVNICFCYLKKVWDKLHFELYKIKLVLCLKIKEIFIN